MQFNTTTRRKTIFGHW